MTLGDEPSKLESIQYATGEEHRVIANSSRKNEGRETKQKQYPVMDVTGDRGKV